MAPIATTALPRLLVTGFEPFGGSRVNPSLEALRALEAMPPAEVLARRAVLTTAVLPVVGGTARGSAAAALREACERARPDFILCLGETGARDTVCVERVAVNQRDYRIADNLGATVNGAPVMEGASNELLATLPVDALVEAIRAAGVRCDASTNAGRFLCNEIMFHAIAIAEESGARGAGFIHVPQLPEQIGDRPGRTGMPLADIVRAVRAVISTLVR